MKTRSRCFPADLASTIYFFEELMKKVGLPFCRQWKGFSAKKICLGSRRNVSLGSPWYWIEAPGWARHPHHSADEVVVGLYHFVDRIFHERFSFWMILLFFSFHCFFAVFWMILESSGVLFSSLSSVFVCFFSCLSFSGWFFWFPRHPCHFKKWNSQPCHELHETFNIQHEKPPQDYRQRRLWIPFLGLKQHWCCETSTSLCWMRPVMAYDWKEGYQFRSTKFEAHFLKLGGAWVRWWVHIRSRDARCFSIFNDDEQMISW